MVNQSLIHDVAYATMRAIMQQLKDDLSHDRHGPIVQLLYTSFKAALEKYEEMVDRREERLFGPRVNPSDN